MLVHVCFLFVFASHQVVSVISAFISLIHFVHAFRACIPCMHSVIKTRTIVWAIGHGASEGLHPLESMLATTFAAYKTTGLGLEDGKRGLETE